MRKVFYRLYVTDMYIPKFEGDKEYILKQYNIRKISSLPDNMQKHMKITYCTEEEVQVGV